MTTLRLLVGALALIAADAALADSSLPPDPYSYTQLRDSRQEERQEPCHDTHRGEATSLEVDVGEPLQGTPAHVESPNRPGPAPSV